MNLLGQLEAAGLRSRTGRNRDGADVVGEARAGNEECCIPDAQRLRQLGVLPGRSRPQSISAARRSAMPVRRVVMLLPPRVPDVRWKRGPHARRIPVAARSSRSHEGYDRSLPQVGHSSPGPASTTRSTRLPPAARRPRPPSDHASETEDIPPGKLEPQVPSPCRRGGLPAPHPGTRPKDPAPPTGAPEEGPVSRGSPAGLAGRRPPERDRGGSRHCPANRSRRALSERSTRATPIPSQRKSGSRGTQAKVTAGRRSDLRPLRRRCAPARPGRKGNSDGADCRAEPAHPSP